MSRQGPLGDEQIQGKLRGLERRRETQLKHDLAQLAKEPGGRRALMWVVYGVARLEGGWHVTGEAATYENGRRAVGAEVLATLQAVAPALAAKAISEEWAQRADEELERAAAKTKTADEAAEELNDG